LHHHLCIRKNIYQAILDTSHLKTRGLDRLLDRLRGRSSMTKECTQLIFRVAEIHQKVMDTDCIAQISYLPLIRTKRSMVTWVVLRKIGCVVQTMWLGISRFLATPVTSRAWSVKICLLIHMEILLQKQLVRNIQLDITSSQENDFFLKTQTSTRQRTSGDSVSITNDYLCWPYYVFIQIVEQP